MDQRCYSIVAGDPQDERFRVSANGTVSILSPAVSPTGNTLLQR